MNNEEDKNLFDDEEDEIVELDDNEELEDIKEEDVNKEYANIDSLPVTDSVKVYLSTVGQRELMTAKEEFEYGKIIAEGREAEQTLANIEACKDLSSYDIDILNSKVRAANNAKKEMTVRNIRLVIYIAMRYRNKGLEVDDMVQEGILGLMKAVDRYDYTYKNRFSTFATWWIRQAIVRAIANQGRSIRLPVYVTEKLNKLVFTEKDLEQRFGREATEDEIAEEMGITLKDLSELRDEMERPYSLDFPVNDEEGNRSGVMGDFVPDSEEHGPAKIVENEIIVTDLTMPLISLTHREAEILKMRLGITDDDKEYNLNEIGQKLSLTRERVRQIEEHALREIIENVCRDCEGEIAEE